MKKKIIKVIAIIICIIIGIGIINMVVFQKEKKAIIKVAKEYETLIKESSYKEYPKLIEKYWHEKKDTEGVISKEYMLDALDNTNNEEGNIENYESSFSIKKVSQIGINKAKIICDYEAKVDLQGETNLLCIDKVYTAELLNKIYSTKNEDNNLENKEYTVIKDKKEYAIYLDKIEGKWKITSIQYDTLSSEYDYDVTIK